MVSEVLVSTPEGKVRCHHRGGAEMEQFVSASYNSIKKLYLY